MDKRGTDKILSIYWFVILFIVAAGIVYMAGVFYGSPYDVRELEANALTNQIADCIAQGGKFNPSANVLSENNIESICGLNFAVEDSYGWSEDQFYVEIELLGSTIEKGNINLKQYCGLKGEGLPYCLERSFYVLDESNNKEKIKILSIVRKIEKNVR